MNGTLLKQDETFHTVSEIRFRPHQRSYLQKLGHIIITIPSLIGTRESHKCHIVTLIRLLNVPPPYSPIIIRKGVCIHNRN